MSYGKQNEGRVLPEFTVDDLGISFKVVLLDSVRTKAGPSGPEVLIPDYQGLIKKIAVTRSTHPRKLLGADIRFLRKSLGLKSKELAEKIDISPEHLSRCEAGDKVLSSNSEKALRSLIVLEAVLVLQRALEDANCAKPVLMDKLAKLLERLQAIMSGMKISPLHSANEELTFHFRRVNRSAKRPANDEDTSDPEWLDEAA